MLSATTVCSSLIVQQVMLAITDTHTIWVTAGGAVCGGDVLAGWACCEYTSHCTGITLHSGHVGLCGTGPSVLIRKVSLFQNYACTHLYNVTGTVGTVLIRDVVIFQR